MANKLATARAIVGMVQSLAPATDMSADMAAEFYDAGTFTDTDLEALGITAADLAACITLLEQVNHLMTDGVTVKAMYRATLNKVRRT